MMHSPIEYLCVQLEQWADKVAPPRTPVGATETHLAAANARAVVRAYRALRDEVGAQPVVITGEAEIVLRSLVLLWRASPDPGVRTCADQLSDAIRRFSAVP